MPTPGPATRQFGGNTPCLEVRCGEDESLILDAGTGLRSVSRALASQSGRTVHILLSHLHWDHIQGLPFFAPLYAPAVELRFYSALPGEFVEKHLRSQMAEPFFPAPWDALRSRRSFIQMGTREIRIGSFTVSRFPLCHPGGCSGLRVATKNRLVVFATDHEWGNHELDRGLTESAQDADLLVLDAQYTDEEYLTKRGWGHTSWRGAVSLGERAQAKRLVLFHHDPARDDDSLARIEEEAAGLLEGCSVAREGALVHL